ncbi:hypothetical protein JAAARDRAFT_253871 [Jaapia argillacea MUCL 33604]|uniref:Protein kinase domain-containing protein n=1 Tax=Jaapia argillacea MUCL 33604 TaxID=933084 RepID=A0A067Q3E0_9AGAM|nr:hypothetical protein JAAARDRAFT_253871 [Jaapia argillacea MUCL 33604]
MALLFLFLVDRLGRISLINAQVEFTQRVEHYRMKDRVPISAYWWYHPTEQLMPPLDDPDGDVSYDLKGDVFAFAAIIYESFGGRLPRSRQALCGRIMGTRPLYMMARPALLSNDRLWHLLIRSWAKDPEQRPSVIEIEDALLSVSESNMASAPPNVPHLADGRGRLRTSHDNCCPFILVVCVVIVAALVYICHLAPTTFHHAS